MGNKKKFMAIMMVGLTAVCLLGGCGKAADETETQSESAQQNTAVETETVKNTYISETMTFSIDLPDTSWIPTKEGINQKWNFKADGVGKINIVHKKSQIATKKLPESQEEAVELLNKEKENAFTNVEYKKERASNADLYYYAADIVDAELNYVYYIRYLVNADTEGYTITAKLTTNDAASVQAVKDAVTSFMILKTDESASGDDSSKSGEEETEKDEKTDSVSTGEEFRYFFDEEGNTIYTYPQDDGTWRDEDGKLYFFLENGVEDENGVKYYYDPPSYRESSNGSASQSDSGSIAGTTADFYDSEGNYITATQNENGYWIGSDGKTYIFSEEGVTDNDGNFTAW